jgi:hypothetical protein
VPFEETVEINLFVPPETKSKDVKARRKDLVGVAKDLQELRSSDQSRRSPD